MSFAGPFRLVTVHVLVAALTACSDTTEPDQAPEPNYVRLQSDAGDFIGGGQDFEYTQADAVLEVAASGVNFAVEVRGDERWLGQFQLPNTLSALQPGTWTNLTRYPFHDPAQGGLSWTGEGRGCNTLTGSLTIDSVTYDNAGLATIDLRFEQHCEGATAALVGEIHWRADDPTSPPGPVTPIPAELWQPAPGSTPATGSFVYLESEAGDAVGAGQTYTYTPLDADLSVTAIGGHLTVLVDGAEFWQGDFQTMNSITQLESGYYPNLQRFPFHNPARGGLSWSGEGRGCNTLTGWFVVDNVTYTAGTLTALDLRFEQHCESAVPALHGAIHWEQ